MDHIHFDFEAALVLATLVTGIFWALDKFLWAPRRDPEQDKASWPVEFSRSFFPVILAVLVLRSFIAEPFRIPSSSMVPTLLEGDFILVNKFAYGLRLPVIHSKLLPIGQPQRGDVAVFRYPPDPSKDFIKRIVGLPGDEIAYRDKQLFINGEPVPLESLGVYEGANGPLFATAEEFIEQLPGRAHRILITQGRDSLDLRVSVPAGHYFAMGDNRDNSADSRRWGFVPEGNLVGKAFIVWMSVNTEQWGVRLSRIGSTIE